MKKALAACVASALLAAAGPAGAQSATPVPAPSPSPERPAATGESGINLKLDEAAKPRPRITFGPAVPAAAPGAVDAASNLPSLGGEPTPGSGSPLRFHRGLGGKDPIPKDTNPGL